MPIKTHLDEPPSLNLTSMMDVVFLLLIFFLTATEFSQDDSERSIDLQVPEVTKAAALTAAPSKREVSVYRDGQIALDGEDVSIDQLAERLASAHNQYAELGVVVRGDGEGRFQRIAEVLNACKLAGINELAISVRLTSAEP